MHPKYARLVRRSPEPQNKITPPSKHRGILFISLARIKHLLKPKFLRRAFAVIILLVTVSWSFQYWIPPSEAFAAPWSSAHNQYNQRKQLTLVNSSGQTFESGTTYKVTIDTQSLASAGSLLSTCDDLRIVYQPSDTQAVELKRAVEYASSSSGVTTCATSSATKVVFQLQANIANAGTDDDYYLYYDSPQASAYSSSDALDAYNVGSKEATFVAPFNGTTQALAAGSGTPTTATGAIRYSGGKSALSFDGKDDYVSATCTTITGPFTVEFWVNAQDHTQGANAGGIFGGISGTDNGQVGIGVEWHTSFFYDIGNWNNPARKITTPAEFGVWTHLAATYDGTFFALFKNGILVDRKQDLNGVAPTISGCGLGAASNYYKGLIDEYRVSNTVRYTSNFTPSTTPFVRDEYTKLLLHFDENGFDPRNTGKAIDDSGNGNHGTITRAKYVGGLIGVDGSSSSSSWSGAIGSQSYAGHEGVFIEEGTTNKITNPSFEHATYNTGWSGITYVGSSVARSAEMGILPLISLPSGVVNGDLMIGVIGKHGATPTTPTGWTLFYSASNQFFYYYRFANNETGPYDFSLPTGNWMTVGGIWVYRGVNSSVIWDVATQWSNSNLAPSLTTVTDNALLLCFFTSYYQHLMYHDNDLTARTALPDGYYLNLAIGDKIISKTGVTGTKNSTGGQANIWSGSMALRPILQLTQNTTTPYYKFGSSSAKIVASADGTLTTTVNPSNTNTHTLSAYVYDGTTGNVGGTVSSSVAALVFNGVAVAASYVDQGGGWWRLTYSGAGIASSQSFGVQVKSGKTVYVDGVQLEEKAYATTYADGTMGTGYAWTGTAHDSTSTRSASNIDYSASSNISNTQGSISFWIKTNYSNDNLDHIFFEVNPDPGCGYLRILKNSSNYLAINDGCSNNSSRAVSWTAGSWIHVVGVWATNYLNIYYNGVAGTPSSTFNQRTITNIDIGKSIGNSFYADSQISDFRILSSQLTSAEITDLYNAGLGSHSSLAPVATERYTDGEPPVLAWHLNEGYGTTAYDSTIYANSGTISGPTWSDDQARGGGGKSLKFDGINDYISRAYTNDTELNPGTSPFSVSTWFKHPSAVTGTDTLISRYSSTGSGGGYKVYMNSSGYICFGVDDDTTWGPDDSACTTVSYADSTWHHVLAIKGASTIAVYIDGIQKASTAFTVTSSLSGSSPTFYTGIDSDGTSNPWDGFIDEVRFYNSVRSEEQINQEYMARGTNKGVSAQFGSGGASDTLSTGLVGYWKMDEASWNGTSGEVLDASGNAYNGVSVNGATTTTGMFGNGGSFDGSNDYVNLPTSIGNFESFPGFTVSTWVNTTSASTRQVIYSNGAAGVVLELYSSGGLRGWLRSQGVSNQIGGGLLSANTWYLVTLTYDYSFGKARLYLNNELKATSASFIYDHGTTLRENVGACLDPDCGGNFNWSGKMDGFRIYNRALSPAEVRALYEYAPGPKVHLQLNDGTGTTAQDSSGNSNTGTLNDGASYTNGKYGKGVKLDGTNDDISVGDFAY